jgi:hypothetical protein
MGNDFIQTLALLQICKYEWAFFEHFFGYRSVDTAGFGVRALIVSEELLVECEDVCNCIL